MVGLLVDLQQFDQGFKVESMASSSRVGEKRRRETYLEVSKFSVSRPRALFDIHASTRKINVERWWDEIFLRNVVKFEYLNNLKRWGWWNLLSLDNEIMSEGVRLFYFFGDEHERNDRGQKLVTKCKGQFITKVYGQEVVVNGDLINDFLGITERRGPKTIPSRFHSTPGALTAAREIFKNQNLEAFVSKPKNLDIHARILHLMFTHTLNPRQGNHAVITKEDAFLMSHVMNGFPPNLGEFIAQKMVKRVEICRELDDNKGGGLPFWKLVSSLIEYIHGTIPISEVREPARGMAPLDVAGLGVMDFIRDPQTGLWVRREEEEEVNVEGEEGGVSNQMLMNTMVEGFAKMNA